MAKDEGEGGGGDPLPPEIIELVNLGDVSGIKALLLKGGGKVDETDNNGMTSLHHAAFKGSVELCKLLISHGSDVNCDSHDHKYSPLHFAALSGSVPCVQELLTAGAKSYYTNNLGRTATQLAAFVGNHAIVALINNYLPFSEIQDLTQPTGLEKEAKLPTPAAKPLYDLVMQVNLHPVRIALSVEASKELQQHIEKSWRALEYLRDKECKRSENVNEVICMKFHYLAFVLKTLENELKKQDPAKEKEKDTSVFESIIRKWVRGRQPDGLEEHIEYFVRDAVKAFPNVEMPLFIQLVRNISGGTLGESSALCVLSGCINGQRAFQDHKACSTCGQEAKELKKCSKCKMAQYCGRVCQKLHWPTHKKFCDQLLVAFKKQEKKLEEERLREEEEKKNESKKAIEGEKLGSDINKDKEEKKKPVTEEQNLEKKEEKEE